MTAMPKDRLPQDEYLRAEEVEALHDLLQQRLESLLKNAHESANQIQLNPDEEKDAIDMAVSESTRATTLRLADRERTLLHHIRRALGRIHQGDYGTCSTCGGPITYHRLMARPVATECIDCRTEREQLRR